MLMVILIYCNPIFKKKNKGKNVKNLKFKKIKIQNIKQLERGKANNNKPIGLTDNL